jgi:hypothetical protein
MSTREPTGVCASNGLLLTIPEHSEFRTYNRQTGSSPETGYFRIGDKPDVMHSQA